MKKVIILLLMMTPLVLSAVTEQTLTILKPEVVEKGQIGQIISRMEENGLQVKAMKMLHMDEVLAAGFYAEHEGRPFYADLVDYMSSGPVVVMQLEGDNAVSNLRLLIGATDPKEAHPGTLRRLFGTDKGRNAVHGSDSTESATREILYFFSS